MKHYKNVILAILCAILGFSSCKKNEESFTLKDDMVTLLQTIPQDGGGVSNEVMFWALVKETKLTSTVDSKGQLIFGDTKINSAIKGQLHIAQNDSLSLEIGSEKQKCKWTVINNDQIVIDSLIWLTNQSIHIVANVEIESIFIDNVEDYNNNTEFKVEPDDPFLNALLAGGLTVNIENMFWTAEYSFEDFATKNITRISREYKFQRVTSDQIPGSPLLTLKP